MDTWKDSYADLVAVAVAGQPGITTDEICARLDLLRDEVLDIRDRLEARDRLQPDA